jgi:hypothetical protein
VHSVNEYPIAVKVHTSKHPLGLAAYGPGMASSWGCKPVLPPTMMMAVGPKGIKLRNPWEHESDSDSTIETLGQNGENMDAHPGGTHHTWYATNGKCRPANMSLFDRPWAFVSMVTRVQIDGRWQRQVTKGIHSYLPQV